MPDDNERVTVDLQSRKSEAEWISALDRFGLTATPVWFNWLAWVLALGAFQFLFAQSQNIILGIIIAISYWLLWLYFFGFFYKLDFKGLPFARRPNVVRIASMVLSGLLALIAWQLATSISREIARLQ